jgi:hypothetical protein
MRRGLESRGQEADRVGIAGDPGSSSSLSLTSASSFFLQRYVMPPIFRVNLLFVCGFAESS